MFPCPSIPMVIVIAKRLPGKARFIHQGIAPLDSLEDFYKPIQFVVGKMVEFQALTVRFVARRDDSIRRRKDG